MVEKLSKTVVLVKENVEATMEIELLAKIMFIAMRMSHKGP